MASGILPDLEGEEPVLASRGGIVDFSPALALVDRSKRSGDGGVALFYNTGHYEGSTAQRYGGSVLYDHGRMSREPFQEGWISGNGRYLFYIGSLDGQNRLLRRELKTGAEVTVDEGDIREVSDPGYDGSVVLYQRAAASGETPTLWRWTEKGTQDLGLRGAAYSRAATAAGMVFAVGESGTSFHHWIGWPKADGRVAGGWREIPGSYLLNRTGDELLYRDEQDRLVLETAEGVREISAQGEIWPLIPQRSAEDMPDHFADWFYMLYDTVGGKSGLCYLDRDLEVHMLVQREDLWLRGCLVSPSGDRICYLNEGDLYQIDRGRGSDFTSRRLTEGGLVSEVYADRALGHLAIVTNGPVQWTAGEAGAVRLTRRDTGDGPGSLLLLRETGPVEVRGAEGWPRVVELTAAGGLYFSGPPVSAAEGDKVPDGSEEYPLFYLAPGEETPQSLDIRASRVVQAGEEALLALTTEGGFRGWLLDGAGHVTPLDKTIFQG